MTSRVTRQMEKLVRKSPLGAREVVRVRRTTPKAVAKDIVKASRTTSDSRGRSTYAEAIAWVAEHVLRYLGGVLSRHQGPCVQRLRSPSPPAPLFRVRRS
jgi:hypothetical protein